MAKHPFTEKILTDRQKRNKTRTGAIRANTRIFVERGMNYWEARMKAKEIMKPLTSDEWLKIHKPNTDKE